MNARGEAVASPNYFAATMGLLPRKLGALNYIGHAISTATICLNWIFLSRFTLRIASQSEATFSFDILIYVNLHPQTSQSNS